MAAYSLLVDDAVRGKRWQGCRVHEDHRASAVGVHNISGSIRGVDLGRRVRQCKWKQNIDIYSASSLPIRMTDGRMAASTQVRCDSIHTVDDSTDGRLRGCSDALSGRDTADPQVPSPTRWGYHCRWCRHW